jgi:hypothetical protein
MSSFRFSTFHRPAGVIVVLAMLQVLCTTYFLNIKNFYAINSILFLLSGIGISWFLLQVPSFRIHKPILINKQIPFKLLTIIILLPVSYQLSRHILDSTPLEKEYADMLPVIKTMCSRFLNGQWGRVYEPIPEIWNGIQPVYLPAMWLPFTSSVIFHFDMRWVTVGGIWLSVLLCVLPGIWKRNLLHFFYGLTIFSLLAWLHFDEVNNVIRLTEEGVVFFYYSLMVIAIISGNPWLVGISAALCLLSRYAIIGWIPFSMLYLIFNRQYKYLFKALAAGSIVVFLIMVLPFGWKPLWYHLQFPSQYISQAARIWNENPEFFYHSPGMAKLFGPAHLQLLHYILLWGSFIIPVLFLVFLIKKRIASNIAMLSCFQLCITFFYSFLDVSYLYLYYTPVFVSIAIAGWTLVASDTGVPYKRV